MAKNKTENFQVLFLPWAGIEEDTTIGRILFWPFNSKTKMRITNKDIVDYLERYFKSYLDHSGKAVMPTIVSFKDNYEFHHPSEAEFKVIRSAVDMLIFSVLSTGALSCVVSNNTGYGPPSADRYQLIRQSFSPNSSTISVQAGSLLSGGWRIGEIKFPMPWHIGGPNINVTNDILGALTEVNRYSVSDDFKRRLFRSFEWFRFAHTESDFMSELMKVVLMSTAFEILLQVPNTTDKKGFVREEIEKRCCRADSIEETRKSQKQKEFTYSKASWWAWDFYDLRNAIVHGDELAISQILYPVTARGWLTHLIVADLVFSECVIYELAANNCINPKLIKMIEPLRELQPDEPIEFLNRNVSSFLYGFNEIHRILGWRSERRKEKP